MGEKKMPGRFTLQFNMDDPQQSEVAHFLERQGCRKTQFITDAVLHYLRYGAYTNAPEYKIMNASEFLNILAKMVSHSLAPQPGVNDRADATMDNSKSIEHSESFIAYNEQDTDYSAITETLHAFDNQ